MFARTLIASLWPVGAAEHRHQASAVARRHVAAQVATTRQSGHAPIALIAETFLVAAGGQAGGRR